MYVGDVRMHGELTAFERHVGRWVPSFPLMGTPVVLTKLTHPWM